MGPLDEFNARRFAKGIATTDVTVKQAYGRGLALRLGFDPGPAGADGGVDGWLERGDLRALFFCRLSQTPLGVKDAREFVAVLIRQRSTVGVVVAAFAGFSPGFGEEVVAVLEGAGLAPALHLLRLQDVLAETEAFRAMEAALGQ